MPCETWHIKDIDRTSIVGLQRARPLADRAHVRPGNAGAPRRMRGWPRSAPAPYHLSSPEDLHALGQLRNGRRTMATWTPDPTFYPSPRLAARAPAETLAYV